MTSLLDVRDAILRIDFASFIQPVFETLHPGQPYQHNWHIDAIAYQLQQVAEGRLQRLLIALPPRHLKSLICSIAFPAWILGRTPAERLIAVSYSADLAADHARGFRGLVKSPFYRRLFPGMVIAPRQDNELDLGTTRHGRRLSTSVGGTLTGQGGNYIIIDDPLKAADTHSVTARTKVTEWYNSTLVSRLNSEKTGAIIVVMQRLHPDDLIGTLMRQEGFTCLSLPSIAEEDSFHPLRNRIHHRRAGDILHPVREDAPQLEALRRDMGEAAFQAQYQQQPVPADGHMLKWAWFKTYSRRPPPNGGDRIVQSWDTAVKIGFDNDWSVCTTWLVQGNNGYLLDIYRARHEFPALKHAILQQAERHRAQLILIEESHGGMALEQDLRAMTPLRPKLIRPIGDKTARLYAQTLQIEQGLIHLPEAAPWLTAFKQELLAFPHGKHDDQVDSLSQFLTWLKDSKKYGARMVDMFIGQP